MSVEGEAKSLMNNEAFVLAMEKARQDCVAAAMACDPRDDEGRRRYLDAARTVDRVVSHLNALLLAHGTGAEVSVTNFYEEQAKGFFARLKR